MKSSRDLPISIFFGITFAGISFAALRYLYPEMSLVFLAVAYPGAALTFGASMHWILTKSVSKKLR